MPLEPVGTGKARPALGPAGLGLGLLGDGPWRGLTRSPGSPIFLHHPNGLTLIEPDFTCDECNPGDSIGDLFNLGQWSCYNPFIPSEISRASNCERLGCLDLRGRLAMQRSDQRHGISSSTGTPYEENHGRGSFPAWSCADQQRDSATACFAPAIALRPVMSNTLTTRLVTLVDRNNCLIPPTNPCKDTAGSTPVRRHDARSGTGSLCSARFPLGRWSRCCHSTSLKHVPMLEAGCD